jgi:hypothetical protein
MCAGRLRCTLVLPLSPAPKEAPPMSATRLSAGLTTAVATLLVAAAGASARPAEQFDSGPSVPATPAEQTAVQAPSVTPAVVGDDTGGTDGDTLTVLAVAGGTLLIGAAAGFGSGRVIARRQLLRP